MANPSAQDVAKRLLILKYVTVQALALPPEDLLQELFSRWSQNEQRVFINGYAERARQVVSSLKSHRLWGLMTKEEQEFVQAVPLKTNFQLHLNAMWCMESAAVLMWVLGLIAEFPPFDQQSDPELLKQVPHEDINKFIHEARLLPSDEIESKRALAELWHWRSRTRQLILEKRVPPPSLGFDSFEQIVQMVANQAHQQGGLSDLIEDDFSARGRAYRDLSEQEWSEVRSITMERHRSLNWLCGYAKGNQWDKTPTET